MHSILKRPHSAKSTQEEKDNMNSHICIKKIESINPARQTASGPDGFIGEFYQTFKKLYPIVSFRRQK
jgi:hypothetical protein